MHDVSNPEVVKTLLEIADAARPLLYWPERRAEIALPGLQARLRRLDELEVIDPPTKPAQSTPPDGARIVSVGDIPIIAGDPIAKVSEKILPEDRATKKILEDDDEKENDPPGSPTT